MKKAIFIILIVLLVDQISKIYIKTHFILGEDVYVFNWFRIHFIENNGMAWGTEFGGKWGKLFLTIFRIIALLFIGKWLHRLTKNKATKPLLIVCVSLIFAGAFGNIIDSVFYGVIFSSSFPNIAKAFPEQPYGELFYGKVVDMLYFPIWKGTFPQWVPFMGGQNFTFFNAIFNVADSSICIGVILLIIFNKQLFPKDNIKSKLL